MPRYLNQMMVLALVLPACGNEVGRAATRSEGGTSSVEPLPRVGVSPGFWSRWSDNRAELSAYRLTTPRYGELRQGWSVLIYVLEEHDPSTWIKDDTGRLPSEERVIVMKLNHTMSFQTGIYPYSVMTSVFSPVGGIGRERFAPTRLVLTSQEWCGQTYHSVLPSIESFQEEVRSYFSVEGERNETVATEPFALYENALLIQLRELDGPFAEGGRWEGQLVPELWSARVSHQPLRPLAATIDRTRATGEDGVEVTRFVLRYDDLTRTYDVEVEEPQRVLGWTTSEGEVAVLAGTERLNYWQLNSEGDEANRVRFGLQARVEALLGEPPAAEVEASDSEGTR